MTDKEKLNIGEIVDDIVRIIQDEWNDEDRKIFTECEFDNLIQFHHGMGTSIRNDYGLWKHEWEPVIVDGVDCAVDHPDAISMNIIKAVWRVFQG